MNETKKCYYLRTRWENEVYNDFCNFAVSNNQSDNFQYMLDFRAEKLGIDYNLLTIEQFSLV